MRTFNAHGNEVHFKNEAATFHTLNTEQEALDHLLAHLDDGHVFVDIGACGGEYSIITECSPYDVDVYPIEPSPDNIEVMREMMEMNDVSLDIINKAISHAVDTRRFNTDTVPAFMSLDDANGDIEVEVATLDALVEGGVIPAPDIIKMDIEGEELDALYGMKSIMRECPPWLIYLEVHTFGYDYRDVYKFLRDRGYVIERLDERDPDLDHENWLIKAQRVVQHDD